MYNNVKYSVLNKCIALVFITDQLLSPENDLYSKGKMIMNQAVRSIQRNVLGMNILTGFVVSNIQLVNS